MVNPHARVGEGRHTSMLLREISSLAAGPLRFMEVCGTHTVSIFRSGMRSLLPQGIELISGPGCPICVTPPGEIDQAIALSRLDGATLVTFGDLMRVPGSSSSLQQEKAKGGDIRVVLSPLDAVTIAEGEQDRVVIFFGVGFETTSPAIAVAAKEAKRKRLSNFFLVSSQRLIPPAMRALLSSGKGRIDGFILPGHVSVVIGRDPYLFIAREFGLPGVITGFESLDILEGLYMLLRQCREGRAEIEIQYIRAVRKQGNRRALEIMGEVFEPVDVRWRGLGMIPASGLMLKEEFADMDASRAFDIHSEEKADPPGCLCGEMLQGLKVPPECRLFGNRCTPEDPVGPCMVSSEGSCAAYYKYGGAQ